MLSSLQGKTDYFDINWVCNSGLEHHFKFMFTWPQLYSSWKPYYSLKKIKQSKLDLMKIFLPGTCIGAQVQSAEYIIQG
jgi:hypothetical protein